MAVDRAIPSRCGCCESGREHLAFVFNHAATPATTAVTLRVPLAGRVVEDIARAEAVAVQPTADGFEWRGTIPRATCACCGSTDRSFERASTRPIPGGADPEESAGRAMTRIPRARSGPRNDEPVLPESLG